MYSQGKAGGRKSVFSVSRAHRQMLREHDVDMRGHDKETATNFGNQITEDLPVGSHAPECNTVEK